MQGFNNQANDSILQCELVVLGLLSLPAFVCSCTFKNQLFSEWRTSWYHGSVLALVTAVLNLGKWGFLLRGGQDFVLILMCIGRYTSCVIMQKVQECVAVLRVDSRLYCSAAPAFFAFCEGEKRTFRHTSCCHVSMLIQLGFVCNRQD